MVEDGTLQRNIDFIPFINYESILCTTFPDKPNTVNAACMGVHFTPTDEVYLHVYEETHTRELLQEGVKFSINFSEDFYEYVAAGLKRYGKDEHVDELAKDRFLSLEPAPILKSAWCTVICEVIPMPKEYFPKPPCRRRQEPNIRAKILTIKTPRYPRLFNNRAFNLALEALLITTKIPELDKWSVQYNNQIKEYVEIKQKITEWRDMERFEESFEVMDNYLIDRGVKPNELFDF